MEPIIHILAALNGLVICYTIWLRRALRASYEREYFWQDRANYYRKHLNQEEPE